MLGSFEAGTTTGTKINQLQYVKMYFMFMVACAFPIFKPELICVLLYAQFLNNSFTSVQTVRNYLSGAKVFLRDRNFNVEVFSHPTLKKLVKGFQRLSDLIPKQAPALLAKSIKQIVDVLRHYL